MVGGGITVGGGSLVDRDNMMMGIGRVADVKKDLEGIYSTC